MTGPGPSSMLQEPSLNKWKEDGWGWERRVLPVSLTSLPLLPWDAARAPLQNPYPFLTSHTRQGLHSPKSPKARVTPSLAGRYGLSSGLTEAQIPDDPSRPRWHSISVICGRGRKSPQTWWHKSTTIVLGSQIQRVRNLTGAQWGGSAQLRNVCGISWEDSGGWRWLEGLRAESTGGFFSQMSRARAGMASRDCRPQGLCMWFGLPHSIAALV